MVRVRPPTLVGHPRTNHQSVMEYERVRLAHLVGHPCLRSRQGNPGDEHQAGVVRGRHSITADQWRQLNQTASSALVILASTPECYETWLESDPLPWSDTQFGLC